MSDSLLNLGQDTRYQLQDITGGGWSGYNYKIISTELHHSHPSCVKLHLNTATSTDNTKWLENKNETAKTNKNKWKYEWKILIEKSAWTKNMQFTSKLEGELISQINFL